MQVKSFFKNNIYVLSFWSALSAAFMMWIAFFMLRYPYVLPDEFLLIQATSVTKNLVLGLEEKPDTNRFLFINVAWDKVLASKEDPQFEGYVIGVEPITDRAKLVGLLKLLNEEPNHQFIVFDIFFKGNTEYDEDLVELINKLPNVVVSYHRDENDVPELPDLDIAHLGLSDIETQDDKCLKFKILHNDSIKSTPLLMYENIHNEKFKKGFWFYRLGGRPVLNSFILDYRIRNFDYLQRKYPQVHLGEWLNPAFRIYPTLELDDSIFDELEEEGAFEEEAFDEAAAFDEAELAEPELLEEEVAIESLDTSGNFSELTAEEALLDEFSEEDLAFADDSLAQGDDAFFENLMEVYDLEYLDTSYAHIIHNLTKDRIIFVGDFEDRDIHETIYGNTPGPIILLDAFLALEAGDNIITIPFLIFLFLAFFLISYITFRYQSVYGAWLQKLTHRDTATFLESLTVYLVYFASVSVISFFLFNTHIGVLILAFYMNLIGKAKGLLMNWNKKKDNSKQVAEA